MRPLQHFNAHPNCIEFRKTLSALIDLVGVFSFFGAALAIINGGARILYAVGRDGLLPRWIAWTHPTRQTLVGAVTLLCIIGLISGIVLGIFLSPINAFAFLTHL